MPTSSRHQGHAVPGREASIYPPTAYAWYVIVILLLVTLFSQLDRQLPALLVKPIRQEFGVSDTAFSLLQGYAFALIYTIAGLPFGRLVDRTNRRNLIILGIACWSAMTVASGFAESYTQLLLARMGVGFGEAVLAPAAYSIIADYVAPDRRGRAMSVYYVSLAVGSGFSLFLGGLVFHLLPPGGVEIPGLGMMVPWRLMFPIAGLPGFLMVLMLLTVREPVRLEVTGVVSAPVSIRDFVSYLAANRATFIRVIACPSLLAIIGYGCLAWAPTLYERRFHIPPSSSGVILGLLVAGSGLVGTLVSGQLSDRWSKAGLPAARFRVMVGAWVILLPGAATWPLVNDPTLSFALLALTITGLSLGQAAVPPSIQDIVPNRMRGQAIAVYLLVAGLAGIGFGPTAVALLTDQWFRNDMALPYSLASVAVPAGLVGLWSAWTCIKPYAKTYHALRSREAWRPGN